MQFGEGEELKSEPGGLMPSTADMDVDLTPPKKRVKSAQASRRTSVEPTIGAEDHSPEASTSVLKAEQNAPEDALTIKADPALDDALLALASDAPTPPTAVPPTKKKKSASTTGSTKKEASAFSATTKSKKASSSTKKASSSEPSSSTIKPKRSPSPPPLPTADEEEEEDNTLYCICRRRQDDVEGGMIMCDRCEQWYHYRCMHITEADIELVDQFICPPCQTETGEKTTYKEACARDKCRKAALGKGFSKYCSERCGALEVVERIKKLGLGKGPAMKGVEKWGLDGRVKVARKTEAILEWNKAVNRKGNEFEQVVESLECRDGERLGLAGKFALALHRDENGEAGLLMNGPLNGFEEPKVNGATALSQSSASSTALTAIAEQLQLISQQLLSVDHEKAQINSRLDRLDLRSTLLHLVSDRVPTLPPVGSTTTAPDAGEDDDETMPDEPAKAPAKRKKGSSKSKTKSTSDTSGGPRCGYDARLHWDDVAFDTWASAEPGRSILSHDAPLDGAFEDAFDTEPNTNSRLICGIAKRKCRRHLDWSNLCEISLDNEKATLNADSRALTQTKLKLVELQKGLEEEMQVVKAMAEEAENRERRKAEERDRQMAMAVANQGTRRALQA